MHGGRSTAARCAALLVVALLAVSGCGDIPTEPTVDETTTAPQAGPAVADLRPGLLDELADRVAAALPAVADHIPAVEAEVVGRWGVPGPTGLSDGSVEGQPAGPSVTGAPPSGIDVQDGAAAPPGPWAPPASAAAPALPSSPPVPVPMPHPRDPPHRLHPPPLVRPNIDMYVGQRLLAAVLPTLDELRLEAPAELVPFVRSARPPDWNHTTVEFGEEDPTTTAAERLREFGPKVIPGVTVITEALAEHERVAPLLRVGAGAEPEIVAAHGRAHLALALVVAQMLVPAADVPMLEAGPEAVIGAALAAVVPVLRNRPMPDTYAAAQLERRRAEYRLPN